MWWTRYIGIPYRDGEASFDGCDCRGLVRLAWAEELKRFDFPSYAMVSAADLAGVAQAVAAEQAGGHFEMVQEGQERPFDVAVIHRIGRDAAGRLAWGPFHLGLVTDAAHVLHCDEQTDTVRLAFRDTAEFRRHASWGRQRFEVWRRRGLA